MNRITYFSLLSLALLTLLLGGCLQDKCARTVTMVSMEPVYAQMADLRQEVGPAEARPLENPGKLYFKDQMVFIAEVNEGVHVIDNSDPAHPQNLGFIRVPGVRDMAVKGNVMYVDSYLDLVSIDISDPLNAREVGREEEVFPYGSWHPNLWADESQGIAIRFEEQVTETEMNCTDQGWGWTRGRPNLFVDDVTLMANEAAPDNVRSTAEIPNGIGGSMARFTLVSDYLYVVTSTDLQSYHLATLANPQQVHTQQVGWEIETIFPLGGQLFIGSTTGMFIYDLGNPAQPQYLSEFSHMRSCDPVVVENDLAYVTLRGGTECGGFSNQLDVIDVTNLQQPQLLATYPMDGPYGLGIRNGILFICDGESGLKIYDASNVNAIDQNQLAHFPDLNAYDVIPLNGVLLMIGEDGFYQYDYSDLTDIKLLSSIPVQAAN